MSQAVRRFAVILGVAVAIGAPAWQAIAGYGLSASEFASKGDSTLRVAGYAFSIWGVIYLGLAAYAVRRIVKTGGEVEAALDWPLALASFGCGLWILAAALDARWASVAIIIGSAAVAISGLLRLRLRLGGIGWGDRLMALWPITLLAGWLTIASAVNLLTVLTAEALIAPDSHSAALIGVGVATAIAMGVLVACRFASYVAPVAWGLVGAFVAERADAPGVALSALICASVLVLAALWVTRASRRVAAARAH